MVCCSKPRYVITFLLCCFDQRAISVNPVCSIRQLCECLPVDDSSASFTYTGKLIASVESPPPGCIDEGCNVDCSCDPGCIALNARAPNCTRMPFMCTWDHIVNYSHVDTICAPRSCLPLPPEDIDWEAESVNASMMSGADVSMNGNILSQTIETNNIMNFNYEDLHNDDLDQPPAPDTVPYVNYPIPDQSLEQPENITGDIEAEEKGMLVEKEWDGDDKLPLVSMNGNNAVGLMAEHPVANIFVPSNCSNEDLLQKTENATLEHLIFGGYFDKPPSPPAEMSLASRQGQDLISTEMDDEDQEASKLVESRKAGNGVHSISLINAPLNAPANQILEAQQPLPSMLPSSILSKAQVFAQKRTSSSGRFVERESSSSDISSEQPKAHEQQIPVSQLEYDAFDGPYGKLPSEVSTAVATEAIKQGLDSNKASEIASHAVRDAGGAEKAIELAASLTITKMRQALASKSEYMTKSATTTTAVATSSMIVSDAVINDITGSSKVSSSAATVSGAEFTATSTAKSPPTNKMAQEASIAKIITSALPTASIPTTSNSEILAAENDALIDLGEVAQPPKHINALNSRKGSYQSKLLAHT